VYISHTRSILKPSTKLLKIIRILRESRGNNIHIRVEQFMKVNGLEDLEMVMEFRNGQMAHNMKENGVKVELVVKVNSSLLMVINMMASGEMIKPMDMGYICMKTEIDTKESG
jgi:tRNA A58 N-methylase Trm61